jgi:hypothetical protein
LWKKTVCANGTPIDDASDNNIHVTQGPRPCGIKRARSSPNSIENANQPQLLQDKCGKNKIVISVCASNGQAKQTLHWLLARDACPVSHKQLTPNTAGGTNLLPGHGAAARPLCLSNFPKVLQRDCHHCHHSGRPRAGATHPNPNGPLQPGSRRTWACWVPPWTTWTGAPTKSSYFL